MDPISRLHGVPWLALDGLVEPLLTVAATVLSERRPAERALDRFLRDHRQLSALQRSAAAEALFGLGLWRRRLAAQLGDPAASPRALLFALLHGLGAVPAPEAARLCGLDPAPVLLPAPTSLADRWSLPDWIAELFTRELGPEEADRFACALNVPGPLCVRANTLKATRDDLRARLAEEGVSATPTRYAPHGLVLQGRPNIYGLKAQQEGLFELQDEGSQLLGALLGTRPGDSVLDICAGAGGKSLLLAADLQNRGALYAYDADPEPLDRLFQRASRAGVNTLRILYPSAPIPPDLQLDRVLVDAPCSSLGALRRGPDLRFRIDPRELDTYPPLQRDLLETAARHVRPGGRLVYATCTLRREENQDVADAFARQHPEYTRVDPRTCLPHPDDSLVRGGDFLCLPHLHGTDAFYAAVFERSGADGMTRP